MASAMEKYLLKTPGNRVSETLNSNMSLDASVLKNLCLWCEFQSRLLFVISLPLKNFLTALIQSFSFANKPVAVSEIVGLNPQGKGGCSLM